MLVIRIGLLSFDSDKVVYVSQYFAGSMNILHWWKPDCTIHVGAVTTLWCHYII